MRLAICLSLPITYILYIILYTIYNTLSASYRQVKMSTFSIKNAVICSKYCIKQSNLVGISKHQQVTGKLNYAQYGMYFIYLGAVSGSSGLINLRLKVSFNNLDTLADELSFKPKRSLIDLLLIYSPDTNFTHACK